MSRQLYFIEDKKLVAKEVSIPELGPHDVYVKPKAWGFNPTDWKHQYGGFAEGTGLGCDAAGEIIKVGDSVSDFKVGDSVAAMMAGGNNEAKEDGTFSTLLKVPEQALWKFPSLKTSSTDEIAAGPVTTFEQAASIPVGLATAALAFVVYNDVPLKKASQSGWFLVYGAGGSLGFHVTQLAAWLGYDVIAVASKKHTQCLTEIGAKHVFDYHEEDWPEKVRGITGDDLTSAYDTISEPETVKTVARALSTTKKAKINMSLWPIVDIPQNIRMDAPLAYFLFQRYKIFGPTVLRPPTGLPQRGPEVIKQAQAVIDDPDFKTMKVDVIDNGFDNIPKGTDKVKEGVSGTKVVIRA